MKNVEEVKPIKAAKEFSVWFHDHFQVPMAHVPFCGWLRDAYHAGYAAPQQPAPVSAEPERTNLHPMGETNSEWYFSSDDFYIDVERDKDGKLSIFCKDIVDGAEGWIDQSDIPAAPTITCQIYGHQVQGCFECNNNGAPAVGYVHLVPDEHSKEYSVKFWEPVEMGTKLYVIPQNKEQS